VAPDYSALNGARLPEQGAGYLQPVWRGAHWTLWQVAGSPGLVSGGARLVALTADQFTLAVERPGAVIVRVRYSPLWTVDSAVGCLFAGADGWTHLRVREAGTMHVVAGLLPRSADRCE